ncbi:CdaR family protein [Lawsonibacter sp. LCP25S3_G6]|uniref:CdaR family protein n=1 Tax=unclassified Lawsonibacter TaxID=2617946 RepID=UPI003F9716F6
MMERLHDSKWVYILLSLLLAVMFWMYVRLEVDPEDSTTIHNVPIELTGTNVLTGQGLTVTGISTETVDLRVSATVSVIDNLIRYRDDIYIPLDVSRLTEGENRLTYQPKWPENFNTSDVVLQGKDPGTITVTVGKLYTSTFNVDFRLNGQVAEGYQMGTPTIEPTTVTVSGSAEEVSKVAKVVAVLENENLDQRFTGDLPLTLLDSQGNPLTDLNVTLSSDTAYVVVPVVVEKEVKLAVNFQNGGGATIDDITYDIDPKTITVSGEESDIKNLTELSIGSIDLAKVVGTNTFTFPISLDPSLENVSGETEATVTVTVKGLDTKVFTVDNISVLQPANGYSAVAVTQEKQVTVRGKTEDLNEIDASQLRIVADLTDFTTTGQISVPVRVYLDTNRSVGVIGEYTIVVDISR